MARPIWKGSISFGLVNIPVELYPAEKPRELTFKMLDKRDLAPIREKRVNDSTGKEVAWEDVAKGYKYDEDKYIVLTEDEIRAAFPKATQTIEILRFVDLGEIDPMYYDKPYFVQPLRQSKKAFKILTETMKKTGRAGVGVMVLRTKAHLVALMPKNGSLTAEFLRFPHELRSEKDLGLPAEDTEATAATAKEMSMAEQLVASMSEPWNPRQYKDTYHDELMKVIRHKAKSGEIKVVEPVPSPVPAGEVVDIADLLRRSMSRAKRA